MNIQTQLATAHLTPAANSALPTSSASEPATANVSLSPDQFQAQPPKAQPLQAILSLWKDEAFVPGQADRKWASDLLERVRNGYHPKVDEMGQYRQIAKASPNLPKTYTLAEITPAMSAIFEKLDTNKNGFLSEPEIKTAIRNPVFKGQQAIAVATLHKLSKSIQKVSWNEWTQTSGVHPKDIKALTKLAEKEKPSKWTLYVESYVFHQAARLQQINPQLFPAGIASIRADQIRQGDYGTCTLLATAGSLASTPAGKQAIQNMISQKPDGNFEVRFPGQKPLHVSKPTDTELILYGNAGPDGLWLSVLEKAFVTQMEVQMAGKSFEEVEKAVNSGMYLQEGIQLLTGHKAGNGSIPDTALPQLREFIKQNLQAQKVLVVTLNPDSEQAKKKELLNKTSKQEEVYADGLVGLHAYSVIAYNPEQDTITLRNPWGNTEWGRKGQAADGKDDGLFTLKLSEFHANFSDISWQTSTPLN